MADQLTGHNGDIPGRGHMAVSRQTVAVLEMGVCHTQLCGPLIHPGHKGLLGARQMLRQRHGTVVGRSHCHRFEHFIHRHLLVFLQVDLTASHAGRIGRGGHHLIQGDLTTLQGLHHQKHGHHLGDAGRFSGRVGILFIKHGAVLTHQDGAGGLDARQLLELLAFRHLGGLPASPQHSQAQNHGQNFLPAFLHRTVPFLLW